MSGQDEPWCDAEDIAEWEEVLRAAVRAAHDAAEKAQARLTGFQYLALQLRGNPTAETRDSIRKGLTDLAGVPLMPRPPGPRVRPVSLDDYLPIAQEDTMSNTDTIEHHNEVIFKAAREALIGTGLELLSDSYLCMGQYVPPSALIDAMEIRIGLVIGHEWPTVWVISRQQIPAQAIYARDGASLIAEVNRACMDARKVIHAQLTAIAAKVDPSR